MKILHYDTLPSTNKTAWEAARGGCEAFLTVVADAQTAGRGRGEHRFFSPAGGLYFSTVLRPTLPPAEYGRITPFAALAVLRACQSLTGLRLRIRWVNDLLLGTRKICGILAESGTDLSGQPFVILGIGINLGDVTFPAEIEGIAGSLPALDRQELLHAILSQLQGFEQEILAGTWLPEFRENLAYRGERVEFTRGEERGEAICLDVSDAGALRLLLDTGEVREFSFGEISLRPAQNGENRHIL